MTKLLWITCMTWPLRVELSGAFYHVTSRGNACLYHNATARFRAEPSWIMLARKLGDTPAQRKIDEARRLTLNSGCSLRLSFLTLLPLSPPRRLR